MDDLLDLRSPPLDSSAPRTPPHASKTPATTPATATATLTAALRAASHPALNAQRLRELAPRLVPRGPLKFATFGDGHGPGTTSSSSSSNNVSNKSDAAATATATTHGPDDDDDAGRRGAAKPVGLHIVQVGSRVVVAACAEDMEAAKSGRVHFGDAVVRVGETWTRGMRVKEVKALIAEAKRPVTIALQPLMIRGGASAPLRPPVPEGEDHALWGLRSRAWALEDVDPPSVPDRAIADVRGLPRFVVPLNSTGSPFVALVETTDGVGHRVTAINSVPLADINLTTACETLMFTDAKPVAVSLRCVEATGAVTCDSCGARGWAEVDACWRCGVRTNVS